MAKLEKFIHTITSPSKKLYIIMQAIFFCILGTLFFTFTDIVIFLDGRKQLVLLIAVSMIILSSLIFLLFLVLIVKEYTNPARENTASILSKKTNKAGLIFGFILLFLFLAFSIFGVIDFYLDLF